MDCGIVLFVCLFSLSFPPLLLLLVFLCFDSSQIRCSYASLAVSQTSIFTWLLLAGFEGSWSWSIDLYANLKNKQQYMCD